MKTPLERANSYLEGINAAIELIPLWDNIASDVRLRLTTPLRESDMKSYLREKVRIQSSIKQLWKVERFKWTGHPVRKVGK